MDRHTVGLLHPGQMGSAVGAPLESGLILSICPPDAALQVARQVVVARFAGSPLQGDSARSPGAGRWRWGRSSPR